MDFVFAGFLLLFGTFGAKKGVVRVVLSVFGILLTILLSFLFCENLASVLQKNEFFGSTFENLIKERLDLAVPGNFESFEEVENLLSESNFGKIFLFFAKIFLSDVSVESGMTFGQIYAPKISNFTLKLISVVIISIISILIIFILKKIFKNAIKLLNLNFADKFLGAVLGIFKGFLLFFVFYILLYLISNLIFSENLLNFARSGELANFFFDNFIKNLVNYVIKID